MYLLPVGNKPVPVEDNLIYLPMKLDKSIDEEAI